MATNDPFRDFRRRRGSLFDEFFSDFFDRPFGADQGTGPSAVRPGTPAQTARRRVEQVDITDFFSDATRGGRTDVAPSLSPEAKAALLRAYDEMHELNSSYLGPEHVLLALAADTESDAGRILQRFGLSHTALRGAVIRGVRETEEGGRPASQTKTLDEYSRDLTEAAREGRLDPVIGRADEIEETIEILSRRTKNNPVLIGDPGVGKTAIAEGIAQRIVNDEVPETLAGKRLVVLDLAGMVAGTKYRGEFEDRLKSVIDEVTDHPDELILFIDELHTVVGAGAAEGSMDASNMLKPALARGELRVIGATTIDEYRRNIEKDAAGEDVAGGPARARGRAGAERARARPGRRGRGLRARQQPEGPDRRAARAGRREPLERPRASGGGAGRRRGRGRVAPHRHPGRAAHPGGAPAPARARGADARARGGTGRRRRGGRPCCQARSRRARRSEPPGGLLPVPGTDRRREDGARPGARGDTLRRRGRDGPLRHERVPGAPHGVAPRGSATGLRRLRGRRPAHRDRAPPPLLGAAPRRDREGARRRLQHPAPAARGRPPDRRPGTDGRLQAHGRDHDLQPGRRPHPGPRAPGRVIRRPEGRADGGAEAELPAGVAEPDRRDHRVPLARPCAADADHAASARTGRTAHTRAGRRAGGFRRGGRVPRERRLRPSVRSAAAATRDPAPPGGRAVRAPARRRDRVRAARAGRAARRPAPRGPGQLSVESRR